MPPDYLDLLENCKRSFGAGADDAAILLARAAANPFTDPADLIRLHETVLFLRAYPASAKVSRLADSILFAFKDRIPSLTADQLTSLEEPEISGIAGTALSAVFGYEVALHLARRFEDSVEIAWDRYEEMDRLGPLLARVLPLAREDWPVEAHAPFRRWLSAACPRGASQLRWLLERMEASEMDAQSRVDYYEALRLPLTWRIGDSPRSRSVLRLPKRKLYCHHEPLLRRGVSLEQEMRRAALPLRRVPRTEARRILHLIVDTSAMRYRQLYGFNHPDEASMVHADPGRGVDIFLFGVTPPWRLPLRAYHCGMFFKNGVPAGYVEVLSLFDRAEVGFNLYYTFREGESAWIYAQIVRLLTQYMGVTCFSVDPYQIGLENSEAISSGAFWFYRKLGFRPVDANVAAVLEHEERAMSINPEHRSSARTLKRLAAGYIVFDKLAANPGAWDRFSVRNVGLRLSEEGRDPGEVLRSLPGTNRIVEAKSRCSEVRYLQLMQRHGPLRAAFLELGSAAAPASKLC